MNLLVSVLIRVFEFLFVFGILGSTVVIILSGVEDVRTALGKDEHEGEDNGLPAQL